MRAIRRRELNARASRYLIRWAGRVADGRPVDAVWDQARRSATMRYGVRATLAAMAGPDRKCMYCSHDTAETIDHFWPKAAGRYPERAFVWGNLLLACSGCQARKGDRFELDPMGAPLLIDPTAQDPWDHLIYDAGTGFLAPRQTQRDGRFDEDPRGCHTCAEEHTRLQDHEVRAGRLRAARHLGRAVGDFLAGHLRAEELVARVKDADDHGLGQWFFLHEGRDDQPFAKLRQSEPALFADLAGLFRR